MFCVSASSFCPPRCRRGERLGPAPPGPLPPPPAPQPHHHVLHHHAQRHRGHAPEVAAVVDLQLRHAAHRADHLVQVVPHVGHGPWCRQGWLRDPPQKKTGTPRGQRVGVPTVVDSSKDEGEDEDPTLLAQELGDHQQAGAADVWGRGPAQRSHPCGEQRAVPTAPRGTNGAGGTTVPCLPPAPSSPASPHVSCTLRVSERFMGTMRSWQSPEIPAQCPESPVPKTPLCPAPGHTHQGRGGSRCWHQGRTWCRGAGLAGSRGTGCTRWAAA